MTLGLQVRHNTLGSFCLMADISEWQRGMDLAAHAAAGFQALSMRASSGSRLDGQFDTFAPWARDLGLKRLYYAWVRGDIPVDQQIALIRQAHARHGRPELGWMLDVEDTNVTLPPGPYAALLARLWDAIVQLDGRDPVIYTSGWYWNPRLGTAIDMGRCPLIVAAYPYQLEGGVLTKPLPDRLADYGTWAFGLRGTGYADRAVPTSGGWSGWDAWQFTSVARVPGHSSNIDLNLVSNSLLELRLGGTTPPPPPPADPQEDDMPITILPTDGPDPKPLYVLMPDGTKRHVTSQGEAAALGGVAPQRLATDVIALIPDWRPPADAQDAAGVVVQQVVGEVRQVGAAIGTAAAQLAARIDAIPHDQGGDVVLRIEAVRA